MVLGESAKLRCSNPSLVVDSVSISGSTVPTVSSVKSFGIIIKAVCFHTRTLRYIHQFIDRDTANTIASSLIGACLDYCNALLYETSSANIAKLQKPQNTFARVVTVTHRCDHISSVLSYLFTGYQYHRRLNELATITYKVLASGNWSSG